MNTKKHVNLEGKTYGKLTILEEITLPKLQGIRKVIARCECGTVKEFNLYRLLSGKTRSCNCMLGDHNRTHGLTKTVTFARWTSMHERLKRENYRRLGVTVCKRWLKFENFLADMGEAPKGMTLDRIDNRKGYSKRNCRWATPKQQSNNREVTVKLHYRGRTLPLTEWAAVLGMKVNTIRSRLYRGRPIGEVLSTTLKPGRRPSAKEHFGPKPGRPRNMMT